MNPLKSLADHGQAVWLDFLSRGFIAKGGLKKLADDGIQPGRIVRVDHPQPPLSYRRRPVSMADMDPGLRRDDELRDHAEPVLRASRAMKRSWSMTVRSWKPSPIGSASSWQLTAKRKRR